MNRVFRLLGLVFAFIWLHGGVSDVSTLFGREPRAIGDFTEPYWTCSGRTCVMNEGCGENTCEWDPDCGGCDPAAESTCINQGWNWDSNTCQCSPPPCNSADRDWCAQEWGTWHEDGCWCENPCNASGYVLVGTYPDDVPLGCQDCCHREHYLSSTELYRQYCQDNRVRDEYTVGTGYYTWVTDPYCTYEYAPWCTEEYWNPFYQCY